VQKHQFILLNLDVNLQYIRKKSGFDKNSNVVIE